MLHELSKVPHPSWTEILISAQIFCLLYPLRIVARRIEKEERVLRKTLIHRHVRHHRGRYAHCKCSIALESPQQQQNQLDQVMASEPEYLFEP